jgi:hypothetical protein
MLLAHTALLQATAIVWPLRQHAEKPRPLRHQAYEAARILGSAAHLHLVPVRPDRRGCAKVFGSLGSSAACVREAVCMQDAMHFVHVLSSQTYPSPCCNAATMSTSSVPPAPATLRGVTRLTGRLWWTGEAMQLVQHTVHDLRPHFGASW